MADDTTDNFDPLLADLAKYGVGAAGTVGANAATQAAYQAAIQNLRDRFGDYSKLQTPNYATLTPQQVGPSALGAIQPDAMARGDEQQAIGQMQDIANRGGLNLSDRNALNQLEQNLSRSATARDQSLANQFASRGQLGSGQQLAMSLAANQNAAQNANQKGEGIAAQAQDRAMKAVLQKAEASRAMSNDDYRRKAAAAEANDAIARYNSSMRADATKYNNTEQNQGYQNQLEKLRGETGLTDSLNSALLGSGKQQANTIAGMAGATGGLVGSLAGLARSGGKGGGGTGNDPGLDYSGQQDASGNRGGAGDLSGGGSLASEDNGAGFAGGAATDASAGTTGAGDFTSLLDETAYV